MLGLFVRSLFTAFMFLLLWINIAFAFNVLNIMNPTNVLEDASQYYFGLSSIIDQFKYYFADNNVLVGYQSFLTRFGGTIAYQYQTVVQNLSYAIGGGTAGGIITMLLALVIFTLNIIPMLELFLLGLFYIIFLLCFAFEIVLFIIAFFGGAFATKLPLTDWWEYTNTLAICMV